KWKIVPMTAAKAGLFLSFALFVDELLFVGGWPYLGLRLNFDGIMGPTSPVIAVAGMGVSSVYLSRKKSRDYNEMQRKGEREKAAALLVSKAKKNEKSDS
ncbi:MAG TPA: hypothetical protein VJN71_09015, partial [Nitrososphaerales archaeon]|nr:hypothetical protein [Nitrososphaerales archaeon]